MQFQARITVPNNHACNVRQTYKYHNNVASERDGTATFNGRADFVIDSSLYNSSRPLLTGYIAPVTELIYHNATQYYQVQTLTYRSYSYQPEFGTMKIGPMTGTTANVPITVNLGLDVYGYPKTITGKIKYCNSGHATITENPPSHTPPGCRDIYYDLSRNYMDIPKLRPGYYSVGQDSGQYTVTDLVTTVSQSSTAPITVIGLELVPGVGFVYVNISLGKIPEPAFQATYIKNGAKSWANADSHGVYTLKVPVHDMLGHFAFNLTIQFKSTVSGSKVNRPAISAITFPGLKEMIDTKIPPPNGPVVMGLSLVSGNEVWNYPDIVPY